MGTVEIQGELWGKMPQDWATLQEPLHIPLWEAMLEGALVGSGTRFLDAGCGGGGGSVLAAERGAQVSGLDAAEGLIRVGDIESLPFDDEVFDAVFAANSVQFTEDRIKALRELGRVCTLKGRIVAGLFGPPEKVAFSAIIKAVRDAMPEPPPGGGPFELSAPGKLEGLFEAAGLNVLESGEVDCPYNYPDFETFCRAHVAAGPFQSMLRVVSEEKLRLVLRDAVEAFRLENGGLLIQPNAYKYVVATRQ
jgi:SAM-dependent methyltransferase